MKKYILLILALINVSLFCDATIFYPPAINKEELSLNKDNTILFFDIHDVLVTKSKKEVAQTLWQHKATLVKSVCAYCFQKLWSLCGGKKYQLAANIDATITSCKGQSGDGWYYSINRYNPALACFVQHMANTYQPMEGIQELLDDLSNYKKILASNIGSHALSNLLQKNDCAQLLGPFKKAHVIRYTNKQVSMNKKVTYSTQAKPANSFFITLKKKHLPKNIVGIFIDDKLKNVKAAAQNGLIGILFESTNQLRSDFNSVGVLS